MTAIFGRTFVDERKERRSASWNVLFFHSIFLQSRRLFSFARISPHVAYACSTELKPSRDTWGVRASDTQVVRFGRQASKEPSSQPYVLKAVRQDFLKKQNVARRRKYSQLLWSMPCLCPTWLVLSRISSSPWPASLHRRLASCLPSFCQLHLPCFLSQLLSFLRLVPFLPSPFLLHHPWEREGEWDWPKKGGGKQSDALLDSDQRIP